MMLIIAFFWCGHRVGRCWEDIDVDRVSFGGVGRLFPLKEVKYELISLRMLSTYQSLH